MRVLHVLASLDDKTGGPLRAIIDLSAASLRYGLDSEIVGMGPLKLADNPLLREKIHSIPLTTENYAYSREFSCWLEENVARFDLVVLNGMWLYPSWAAYKACLKKNIPFVAFPHGMLDRWPIFGQGWAKFLKKFLYWHARERFIFLNAASVFFTSERELANSRFTLKRDCRTDLVIPYGVALNETPVSHPENDSLIQPDSHKVALFLSRLHPKKNIPLLLKAWAKAKVPSEWRLVIAGSGTDSYTTSLKKLSGRLGIEDCVFFAGHVTGIDKAYLFSRADWFLLPSEQENFGIAVIEAIGYGCAVAISNQVYVAEYLHKDSEVIPLSLDRWAEFIGSRMQNPTLTTKLADLNMEILKENFSIDKIADAWTKTLSQFAPLNRGDAGKQAATTAPGPSQ